MVPCIILDYWIKFRYFRTVSFNWYDIVSQLWEGKDYDAIIRRNYLAGHIGTDRSIFRFVGFSCSISDRYCNQEFQTITLFPGSS